MSEARFYSFMRFDPALARKARGFYVPMFAGCRAVLDVASGRGEFLEGLRDAGIPGTGIDLDEGMLAVAHGAGLTVERADAFPFLRDHEGAYDGVFSAHFVEHLPYERAAELIRLCATALRPGGRLVVCTPNAASLPTLQHQFWWEPTHVRFYDAELLKFMLAEAGLKQLESGVNPQNHPGSPIDLEALKLLRIGPLPPNPAARLWTRVAKRLGLRALGSRIEELDRRTQADHHQLGIVADSLRSLLQELYVSSEVYASGTRPAD